MPETLSHRNTMVKEWEKAPENTVFCTSAEGLLFRLPRYSIDTFWFSPPYNLADRFRGGNSSQTKVKTQYDNAQSKTGDGTGLSEPIYQAQQALVLALAGRALKPGGVIFYSHKVRLKEGVSINPRRWLDASGLHVIQEVIWARGNTANGDPRRFRPTYETIYVLSNRTAVKVGNIPEFRLNNPGKDSGGQGYPDVWALNHKHLGQNRAVSGHPATAPLEIVRRCLEVAPNPKGLTCDPYCGTGTTGVAAREMGGRYLLSDLSLSWATYAENRLQERDDAVRGVPAARGDEDHRHRATSEHQSVQDSQQLRLVS